MAKRGLGESEEFLDRTKRVMSHFEDDDQMDTDDGDENLTAVQQVERLKRRLAEVSADKAGLEDKAKKLQEEHGTAVREKNALATELGNLERTQKQAAQQIPQTSETANEMEREWEQRVDKLCKEKDQLIEEKDKHLSLLHKVVSSFLKLYIGKATPTAESQAPVVEAGSIRLNERDFGENADWALQRRFATTYLGRPIPEKSNGPLLLLYIAQGGEPKDPDFAHDRAMLMRWIEQSIMPSIHQLKEPALIPILFACLFRCIRFSKGVVRALGISIFADFVEHFPLRDREQWKKYIGQILIMHPFGALDLSGQAALIRLLKTTGVATGLEQEVRQCFEMHPAEALLSQDVGKATIPDLIRRLAAIGPDDEPRFAETTTTDGRPFLIATDDGKEVAFCRSTDGTWQCLTEVKVEFTLAFLSDSSSQRQVTARFNGDIIVEWVYGLQTPVETVMRRFDGRHAAQIVALSNRLRNARSVDRMRRVASSMRVRR